MKVEKRKHAYFLLKIVEVLYLSVVHVLNYVWK